MKQATLQVEGMSCQHCVNGIEGALKELGAAGRVDLAGRKVEVAYDSDRISLEQIREAIEEQGYEVL
ncbi:copper chaperone CopZ [Paenibacillus sp. J31TS4]|uniref:copper ion binding protein n=1 Tax=Paenibacillus sp. J31TS4 TaxID=2807195 RepID=UPI001B262533|nr:copper ion binding protein [Paenibacillus sp. J31TS4]GIP39014.1 copper chaperone CopZ [Paenibacillus sp. J31TS4]